MNCLASVTGLVYVTKKYYKSIASKKTVRQGCTRMSWLKTASNSLIGALGLSPAPSESVLEDRTEEIRQTMLSGLGEKGAELFPGLRRRLMFAADLEALWYLRSEWMGALSSVQGERVASAHLRGINIQFEGLLSKGMSSRPSPLSER
jgi:hypothetical protein